MTLCQNYPQSDRTSAGQTVVLLNSFKLKGDHYELTRKLLKYCKRTKCFSFSSAHQFSSRYENCTGSFPNINSYFTTLILFSNVNEQNRTYCRGRKTFCQWPGSRRNSRHRASCLHYTTATADPLELAHGNHTLGLLETHLL